MPQLKNLSYVFSFRPLINPVSLEHIIDHQTPGFEENLLRLVFSSHHLAGDYIRQVVLRLQASEEGRRFEEVMQLLRQRAVMGKKLTVGRLREAIALDHTDHHEEWLVALQGVT